MPWRARKSLAKALLPSSCAARGGRPEDAQAGGAEAVDDAGDQRALPVRPRSRPRLRARPARAGRRCRSRRPRRCGTSLRVAVPALPGATSTSSTRGDCASFQASACSRPPEPMTRIFMPCPVSSTSSARRRGSSVVKLPPKPRVPANDSLQSRRARRPAGRSVAEMAHAGEHHRDAVLVGRGDDFAVAHRTARLDHRRMPAAAAASMPSRNGKNASLAITEPGTTRPASSAFRRRSSR